MAELLLELLSEEIPARMQARAAEDLARLLGEAEEKRQRFERIMAIAKEASKLFPPGTSSDHSDLYDEDGLPR